MNIRYQQIQVWPRKRTVSRSQSRFNSTYPATLDLLESEIGKLRGSDVILQGFMPKTAVRADGWPLAATKNVEPGMILSFHAGSLGNMSYHSDQYYDWRDNLRGIALTLEALRAIRRYGAVAGDEQYRGFAALQTPDTTIADAATELRKLAATDGVPLDAIMRNSDIVDELRRLALRRAHPDNGGDSEQFRQLQDRLPDIIRVLKEGRAV